MPLTGDRWRVVVLLHAAGAAVAGVVWLAVTARPPAGAVSPWRDRRGEVASSRTLLRVPAVRTVLVLAVLVLAVGTFFGAVVGADRRRPRRGGPHAVGGASGGHAVPDGRARRRTSQHGGRRGLYFTAGEVGGVSGPLTVGVLAADGGFGPALAVAAAMAIVALSPTSVGQRAARAEERNRRADRVDRAGGRRSAP
ncbi:MAG: hypothetical protein ACFCVK_25610 [Acidimicrobiales bacterium]